MNLSKLFEMQKVLDEHIMDEHPALKGQNNLDWKILALQVELGECANEWRGFKKWSKDQEPRTHVQKSGLLTRAVVYHNPLLEEYVDCLHFILSIGLELNCTRINGIRKTNLKVNTITIFTLLLENASQVRFEEDRVCSYIDLFATFLQLGEMLGFTWEQIEQAYFAKNAVNHQRQDGGY
jgi:dimeric dUTPase (all-alpha-NTP-PPase superfamily)